MSEIIEAKIETLHIAHPQVRAEDWRSPLARRLLGTQKYADGEQVFRDSFSNGNGSPPNEDSIRFTWTGLEDDFRKCMNTYQAPVLTEFATLGLSCVLLEKRASLEITEVTLRGERADYWLGDKELLLEASGEQSGSLSNLHRDKAKQLKANPFEKDGYVCVADFDARRAELWYHAYE